MHINKEFVYYQNGIKVVNKHILERIKQLRIPPGWENVKISNSDSEYLQATGTDNKNRVQYVYHPSWVILSEVDKYNRLKLFAKKLPCIIKHVEHEIKNIDLGSKKFIVCVMFMILFKTHMRIGNDCFAEENNTYGLTTLLKKHVIINKDCITFSFVGKKGVKHNVLLKDVFLRSVIISIMKIPGPRLFKTTDSVHITSSDINAYVKNTFGYEFSSKDFRTYAANDLFIKFLKREDLPKNQMDIKRTINKCYELVANELGHTKAICKSSYVMPIVSEIYSNDPKKFIEKTTLKTILDTV